MTDVPSGSTQTTHLQNVRLHYPSFGIIVKRNCWFVFSCISNIYFVGLHLEGPFISTGKRGAHNIDFISNFHNGFTDVLDTYGDLENVALVTLAPELNCSSAVIKELCQRGVRVSLGNTSNIMYYMQHLHLCLYTLGLDFAIFSSFVSIHLLHFCFFFYNTVFTL